MRINLGRLPIGPKVATNPGETAVPDRSRQGRMPVILTVHGGSHALADVMQGLVERNERSIRSGVVPFASAVQLPTDGDQKWRDAVTAMGDGVASAGTVAAWRAAEERVKGRDARVALVSGIPAVALMNRESLVGLIPPAPGASPVTVAGFESYVGALAAQGEQRAYRDDFGPVQEQMLLTLDDGYALPVREVNTAIARHNALRIKALGLPKLYSSGVVYKTEGSPELWWDAEEILRNGHDDCEGLAAYRAGELMLEGHDAIVDTRFIQAPDREGRLFHAVTRVRTPDPRAPLGFRDEYDDPSARLGMPIPTWYREYCARRRAEGLRL